jgi:hypothetical protein
MFYARADRYQHNNDEALKLKAAPAHQETPEGQREPAVSLSTRGYPRFVLPAEEAFRLASEIVAALERHQQASK